MFSEFHVQHQIINQPMDGGQITYTYPFSLAAVMKQNRKEETELKE